jgi:hypothetical protein
MVKSKQATLERESARALARERERERERESHDLCPSVPGSDAGGIGCAQVAAQVAAQGAGPCMRHPLFEGLASCGEGGRLFCNMGGGAGEGGRAAVTGGGGARGGGRSENQNGRSQCRYGDSARSDELQEEIEEEDAPLLAAARGRTD